MEKKHTFLLAIALFMFGIFFVDVIWDRTCRLVNNTSSIPFPIIMVVLLKLKKH